MELLIMQLSPASSHFQIPRVSKYRTAVPCSQAFSVNNTHTLSLCVSVAANNTTKKEHVYGSKEHVLLKLFYVLRPFCYLYVILKSSYS
jgi:hypothetical protein